MLTTMIAGVLLLAAPAQQKDTTFNVDPRGRLQIEDLRGDLKITTWDRPQARVSGPGAGVGVVGALMAVNVPPNAPGARLVPWAGAVGRWSHGRTRTFIIFPP